MITDLERRVIGNLAIPRNATDLYQRLVADENTMVGPGTPQRVLEKGDGLQGEADVDKYLREHLQPAGYVVKINPVSDVAKLMAHLPKHNHGLHEESQEILARRLTRPDLAWRARGDLWILSDAGLEAVKEPVTHSPDLVLTALQGVIDAQWARVGADMTEEEFGVWLASTLAYYDEEREHLRLPMAGGASGWSDAFELTILDQENQKTLAPALVDPWFMALSILAFTDADTGTTADDGSHVPTYTGWARKSVAASLMSAAAAGSSNNSGGAITFAACTAGTSTILAFANCSAVTLGILRKWGDCASTVISTTQTPATFNTAAYVTTAT